MNEPLKKLPTLQGVKGMNDILLDEAPLWETFEASVQATFRSYGYRYIRTPIVEPTALFVRGLGEVTDIVEKEMYTFTDTLNGDKLTLRPEATAGIVRSAIEHSWLYNGAQRVWTMGAMFRHERPQKGRYRQFHQADVEALGFEGPDVDAEQMILLADLWRRLGLPQVALHINSIGDAAERAAHRAELIRYFEANASVLDEEAKRRLHTNPLRILDSKNSTMQSMINGAPKLLDFLGEASTAHFNGVKALLDEAGVAYTINPRLVRGMDYYNRTVFEWVTNALGNELTIAGGGRYDGLFTMLGGKATPACGFGIGIERVILVMQSVLGTGESAGADTLGFKPDAYIVFSGEINSAEAKLARQAAAQLRAAGKAAVLHAGGGSFKSQLKKADASGANYAVIVGSEEAQQGSVTLKPLRVGFDAAQLKVELNDLVKTIAKV